MLLRPCGRPRASRSRPTSRRSGKNANGTRNEERGTRNADLRRLPSWRQGPRSNRCAFGARQRVADDALELFEIRDEAAPAVGREPDECLGPPLFEAFPHFDQMRFAQNIEVTAEIAVGERAQTAQHGELESLRMCDERREN